MKKVNINILKEQALPDDEDSLESGEIKTDSIPEDLQERYEFVINSFENTGGQWISVNGQIQQVLTHLEELRSRGDHEDIDLTDLEDAIKQNETRIKKQDRTNLKSVGNTARTGYNIASSSDKGETSCMDSYGNNPIMTTSIVLIGSVVAPVVYHNFLSPQATSRLNAGTRGLAYLMNNIKNTAIGLGWERTPKANQMFREFLKQRLNSAEKLAGYIGKSGVALKVGGAVAIIGALTLAFLKPGKEEITDEVQGQARENLQKIAEMSAIEYYLRITKDFFRYGQKIDPEADYLWNDPCALTALVVSTAAGFGAVKAFRTIKPGRTGQVRVAIINAAAEAIRNTQSLAGALIKFGDDFFEASNLEKILETVPSNPFFGSDALRAVGGSQAVGVGLLGRKGFDDINAAAKQALTGATDDIQQAGREQLGTILGAMDANSKSVALVYLDELEKSFSLGQRAVLKGYVAKANVPLQRAGQILNLSATGLGNFLKRPYTWITSRAAPRANDDVIKLLDDAPITQVDEFAEFGVKGELARSVDKIADTLKIADEEVLTIFYGPIWRSFRRSERGFDEILDTVKLVKKQVGESFEAYFTSDVMEAIRIAFIESRRKLAREVGPEKDKLLGYSKLADELEGAAGDGSRIILSSGTKESIKELSDDFVRIAMDLADSQRFENIFVRAFKEFLSKLRSLKTGDKKAISTELKNANLKIDDELSDIIRKREIDGGSMPRDVEFEIPELARVGGIPNSEIVDIAARESVQEILSTLTRRTYQLTESGADSVKNIARNLASRLEKETRRRKKVAPTNLTNLGPEAETAAIATFVVGAIGLTIFKIANVINAHTETRVVGSGDNQIRKEILNKIPEGEETFIKRSIINWYIKTFKGRKSEGNFIDAHENILEDGTQQINKKLLEQNLKGIFFNKRNSLDQFLAASAYKKDQKEDNLFLLFKDIKEGLYDVSDPNIDEKKAVSRIMDRFCTIRRPQIEAAARATITSISESRTSSEEEDVKLTEDRIKLLAQLIAVTYILENPQFEIEITELLNRGDVDQLEYEEIGDYFEYDKRMVDSVANFILNDLGKTNIFRGPKGQNIKRVRRKESENIQKLKRKKEQLEAELNQVKSTGEDTVSRRFEMSRIEDEIKEIEDEIKKLQQENIHNKKSVIYGREMLSKLVLETLKEYKGYSPYPYHSNIGMSDEPADDYIEDWKDFELSLVRDQSRSTAIDLAKILVKDLELFGDVIDLVGKNQSVGTEILKKLRKKQIKKS